MQVLYCTITPPRRHNEAENQNNLLSIEFQSSVHLKYLHQLVDNLVTSVRVVKQRNSIRTTSHFFAGSVYSTVHTLTNVI